MTANPDTSLTIDTHHRRQCVTPSSAPIPSFAKS